jgi:RimJ/RimL family protein N-acetyltransferase
VFEVFSDPEVMRYWSRPPVQDPAEVEKLIRAIREHVVAGTLLQWAIALREDDRVIGHVSLFALESPAPAGRARLRARQALVAPGAGARSGDAGAAPRVRAAGPRRIEADIDPRNQASIGLMQRLGFRHEGTMRERWFVAGELQDSALYALLARDWRE